jgi:cell division protein FtsQ
VTETVFRQRSKASSTARRETPSLVDPRLQARRIEVARGQGRRRLRWIVLGMAVVALVAGAIALTQSPVLDVDRVTVKGADRTEQAEARAASGIARGSAMVGIDVSAAERRLEALPWVESATVTRSWPGTVQIALVERTPLAIVGTGSVAVEVDRDGRVLGPAAGGDGLPVVAGQAAAAGDELAGPQRQALATLADLPKDLRADVAAARATSAGIGFTLSDGIEVSWGDRSQPSAKADALQVLLEQAGRDTIATIDVSVPRAATVTRT